MLASTHSCIPAQLSASVGYRARQLNGMYVLGAAGPARLRAHSCSSQQLPSLPTSPAGPGALRSCSNSIMRQGRYQVGKGCCSPASCQEVPCTTSSNHQPSSQHVNVRSKPHQGPKLEPGLCMAGSSNSLASSTSPSNGASSGVSLPSIGRAKSCVGHR
jgi:hypothetical protein